MSKRLQEIFDRVAIHLLIQSKKSKGEKYCLYRGEKGLMCGVGCLIKDEFYSDQIEDLSVLHPLVKSAVHKSIGGAVLTRLETGLLDAVQVIHDEYEEKHWGERLNNLATNFGLKTDAIDFAVELKEGMKW